MNATWKTAPALVALVAVGTTYGATLKGTVQTADGDRIAARITILRGGSNPGLATHDTDASGAFSIEVDTNGLLAAAASARGYASEEIDLSRGVPSGGVRFVLRTFRIVQGHVRDANQQPVQGVGVRIRNLNSSRRIHIDDAAVSVTDDSGVFSLAIPAGSTDQFVADVFADGWIPLSKSLGSGAVGNTEVGEGSLESILVSLELQGASLSGRVTSASGATQSDVTVLISVRSQPASTGVGGLPGSGPGTGPVITPFGETFRARIVTDSDGRYAISGLPPGKLAVVAIRPKVRVTPKRFEAVEGGSLVADFVLPD
jgi:hypothetical protein